MVLSFAADHSRPYTAQAPQIFFDNLALWTWYDMYFALGFLIGRIGIASPVI